ncbi:MAG: hypothetical protein U9P50_01040 [Patescibacteria group bacterium]|nr:hypothetical protein [Patescibacteria group bacterium]
MKKEKVIGLGLLSLFLIAGVSTVFANGYGGGVDREARQATMEEHKAQMGEIFENGTYSDWVNFSNQNLEEKISGMRERHTERMSQITSENWEGFTEAHRLMIAGDVDGAKAIFEELGIEKRMGKGMGEGGHFKGAGGSRFNR